MKISNIIRLTIIGALWLWLALTILLRGGITLINLFWVAASGILVFVPLYRKYVEPSNATDSKSSAKNSGQSHKKRR